MFADHVVKTYSNQQRTVALSSAEAELYAMVAASAEALAIIAYAGDLGMSFEGEVFTDSSAALGISQRAGIGKVRHLRTQGLWVQECRVTGRLAYHKVLGTKNPADVLTKHVPGELLDRHLETIGAKITQGRAELAPEIDSVQSLVREFEWDEDINYGDEDKVMKVSFHKKVNFRAIPSANRGRQCGRKKGATKWQKSYDGTIDQFKLIGNATTATTASRCGQLGKDDRCPECGRQSGLGRWGDEDDDDGGRIECMTCVTSGRLFSLESSEDRATSSGSDAHDCVRNSVGNLDRVVGQSRFAGDVTSCSISKAYRICPVRTRVGSTVRTRPRDYTGVNRPGRAIRESTSGANCRESVLLHPPYSSSSFVPSLVHWPRFGGGALGLRTTIDASGGDARARNAHRRTCERAPSVSMPHWRTCEHIDKSDCARAARARSPEPFWFS